MLSRPEKALETIPLSGFVAAIAAAAWLLNKPYARFPRFAQNPHFQILPAKIHEKAFSSHFLLIARRFNLTAFAICGILGGDHIAAAPLGTTE